MEITLRPIDPANDLPRIAELMNTVSKEPVMVDRLVQIEKQKPEGQVRVRMAAVDAAGRILGYSDTYRNPWHKPGRYYIEITVDPAQRRQGIGARLYADALAFTQAQGAASLGSQVNDDDPDSLAFAERRGFKIGRHFFDSRLELATFDPAPFAGVVEAAEASGIRFCTLADLGDTEEARQAAYDLFRRTQVDDPSYDGSFPPYDAFKHNFSALWYRPDALVVALDGDQMVGAAWLGYYENSGAMHNKGTGVDARWRGRRLALACKLVTIRVAQRYGAPYIWTENDSQNGPMLAINRKLGYVPRPGEYWLVSE